MCVFRRYLLRMIELVLSVVYWSFSLRCFSRLVVYICLLCTECLRPWPVRCLRFRLVSRRILLVLLRLRNCSGLVSEGGYDGLRIDIRRFSLSTRLRFCSSSIVGGLNLHFRCNELCLHSNFLHISNLICRHRGRAGWCVHSNYKRTAATLGVVTHRVIIALFRHW